MTDLTRRKFIQLSVVGSAVAATGCRPLSRYSPGLYRAEVTGQYGGYDNRVYPYLNQPDGLMDGVPQYFATVCQMCPAGCGLLIRTMGGRALKVEGNPEHPISRGASCARGQTAMQHLYNPDRLRRPALHAKRGDFFTRDRPKDANPPDSRETVKEIAATPTDWETALAKVASGLTGAKGRVALLVDAQDFGHSPTQMKMLNEFASAVGGTITTYSLLDDAPWRAAAKAVYGKDQVPAYQLDEADVIVSFGGDFLEAWPSPVLYGRLYGAFRQGPRRTQGNHGRFIYIGPRMSMTAANADQWLPCNPGTEAVVASAIRALLGSTGTPLAQAASASGLTEAQIQGVAEEMRRAGSRSLAVAGNGLLTSANTTAAFTAVESLNVQTKSQCVGFGTAALAPPAPNSGGAGLRGVQQLVGRMQAGQVGMLILVGNMNPVFSLPSKVGFTPALAKVPTIAALNVFDDETTAYADVVLPIRSFLEDWGDHVPPVIPAGARMATLRQPIIDPQFVGGWGGVQDNTKLHEPWMDTRPLGDILRDLAARTGAKTAFQDTDSRAAVRRTWAGLGQATLAATTTENDRPWVNALSVGGVYGKAVPDSIVVNGGIAAPAPAVAAPAPLPKGTFALHLYPQIYNHDGRHANLGFSQENPDPMTMAVWNSWVEINVQVAHELDIRTGDMVKVTASNGQSVTLSAIPYPGLHPGVVAMPIGQGHEVYGRNAAGRGYNPLPILEPVADPVTGALAYGATTVKIEKIASAKSGYFTDGTTLVLAQDRPGGQEPDDLKDLIHTTAKEWKTAKRVTGPPKSYEPLPGSVEQGTESGHSAQ